MNSKAGGWVSLIVILGVVALGYFNVPPAGPWIRHWFYRIKGAATPQAAPIGLNRKDPKAAAACRANLETIERAKAAIRGRGVARATGDATWAEIMGAMNLHQRQLLCPAGGTYDLGSMTQAAKCSIGGNQTPDAMDDHLIRSY
jgi:hypothetical protein